MVCVGGGKIEVGLTLAEGDVTVNLRLLVPMRKNEKLTSDQSNSPYSVTFRYSLHLIGQFGFLFIHGGTKKPEIYCVSGMCISWMCVSGMKCKEGISQ